MALNPYFNFLSTKSEQDLIESLIVEAIQIFGVPVIYLPRSEGNLDPIYGEDPLSSFQTKYEMEMYFKSYDSFGGEGEFLSKFGIQVNDTAVLTVANTIFETATGGDLAHPREGDLVYLSLSKQLFEIKFVEKEATFYQLGKLNTYDLKVELFKFSHEVVSVGDPDIDALVNSIAFTINLTMKSAGSGTYVADEIVYQGATLGTATAKATVVSYNATTRVMEIKDIFGEFALNTNTIGNTSGANRQVNAFDAQELPNDPIADNKVVSDEATTVIVTTTNPLRNP